MCGCSPCARAHHLDGACAREALVGDRAEETIRVARKRGTNDFRVALWDAADFAKRRSCQLMRARFPPAPGLCYNSPPAGEMDERFKSHAWKACIG